MSSSKHPSQLGFDSLRAHLGGLEPAARGYENRTSGLLEVGREGSNTTGVG
jgi:hypothetical protein